MSSRGTVVNNGHVGTDEYDTEDVFSSGAEVLSGKNGNHSLPDYSHSPNRVYIKLNPDGTFREMRFYGPDHKSFLEIGFHSEPGLNKDKRIKVWHYHTIDGNFKRSDAAFLTKSLVSKYRQYLEEVGYDQW